MENLKLRVLIKHVDGGDIAYLYNREAINLLNLKKELYDNSQFIEINSVFEYEGDSYIVERINFKIFEKEIDMENLKGMSLSSPTEQSNYNCQVVIFVKNANS